MKRKYEISYMNILLCMAVIMIHVISGAVAALPRDTVVYYAFFVLWRLLLCAVPGFIFLSGLKLSLRPVTDWRRFYTRRFTSVIIPYLIWMPIYYIASWRMHIYSIGIKDFITKLFDGTGTAHFYFIIVIVQFYLLMPLWQLLTRKVHPVILLAAAAWITCWSQAWLPVLVEDHGLVLPLTNDRLFINYLLPWIAGCICGAGYDKISTLVHRLRYLLYIIAAALAAWTILFADYVNRTGLIYLQLHYVNLAYCMAAIFALWGLFLGVSKKHEPSSFLKLLDKSSYYIYLTHLLVLMAARYFIETHFPSMGILHQTAIYLPVTYIIPTAACMAYTAWKQRR